MSSGFCKVSLPFLAGVERFLTIKGTKIYVFCFFRKDDFYKSSLKSVNCEILKIFLGQHVGYKEKTATP